MSKPIPLFDTPTTRNLVLESRNSESQDVWSSDRWTERQRDFLFRSLIGEEPRSNSLFDLVGHELSNLHIIDFGGGSGWLLHVLERKVSPVSYTNVEKLDLHSGCEEKHLNYNYLNIEKFEASPPISDASLLYINSVIQYFHSEQELTRIINLIKPKHVVLDDVTLSEGDEFFSYQKYYESQIPYRFVEEQKLIENMVGLGYALLESKPFERIITNQFSYDFDFPDLKLEIGETKSFYFSKVSQLPDILS